jgi:protein required for attachment to host cells
MIATKRKTWIVVADGSRARVYERLGRNGRLAVVLQRDDPQARKRTSDIVSDRRGRNTAAPGIARHAMDPKTTAHDHLEESFVRGIAREIDHAAALNRFDELIVIAPPRALGEMRQALSPGARSRVVSEIDKELVHLDARQLADYLEEHRER